MGRNKVNWGLCVSMLLHILLMAVPMTITGIQEFKEIELFVMEEKPEVREERFMESAKTASISRTIKPVVIKDPNTLPVSPSVEEKKVENETGIEPQKGEMETALKERSKPFSQPPLTSILEAERKEEEIKELARLKEEEEDAMVSQTTPLQPSTIRDRHHMRSEETPEGKPQILPQALAAKGTLPVQQGNRSEDQGSRTAFKQTHLPQDEIGFGSEDGPQFLHQVMPIYPLMARRLGKEGRVVLRLTIDEKGKLLNVEVLVGAGYGLTEAAVEAVKRSKFLPAKKEGKPVSSKAILPVRFILRRSE